MAGVSTADVKLTTYWVKDVLRFSSEYATDAWGVRNIIGPSRVYPQYGDNSQTWTHSDAGSPMEFIEVSFEEKVFIRQVDLYETYNGGAVVKIELKTPSGDWTEVFSTQQTTHEQTSRIYTPNIQTTNFRTNEMKITFNCSLSGDWYELDAIEIKGTPYLGAPPPPLTELSHDLGCMVNKQDFSDVTFRVEGKTIYGHKVVLAARCPYFKKKFGSGKQLKTEEINMKNMSYNALLALVEFLYTNDIDTRVRPETVTDLLRFAMEESMESLKNFCLHRIFTSLTSDNVVKIYRDASEKSPVLDSVVGLCIDFMSSHMDTVCRVKDFKGLPQHIMLDIIQRTAVKK